VVHRAGVDMAVKKKTKLQGPDIAMQWLATPQHIQNVLHIILCPEAR
jgi:hypothetical protein